MRRVLRRFVAILAMCAVVGTIMPNMARAEEAARLNAAAETPVRVKWSRIAGQNRYETAAAIVGAGFDKSVAVVVASGENYPDALAASALAGVLSAPVVLTAHGMLPQETSERIESLGATTALVVGGTSAVSGSVFEQLSKMGLKTMRVEGSTRCNTAVAAMKSLRSIDARSDTVIVASGYSFADSLAIAPWAWSSASPILLTDGSGTLPQEAVDAIHSDPGISKVVIVGGEAVVDDYVYEQIGSAYHIRRLGGENRYETAQLIMCFELANGLGFTEPIVATGRNFPDALAGAALCGKRRQVLVLAEHGLDDAVRMVRVMGTSPEKGFALGGPAVLSDLSGQVAYTFGLSVAQEAIIDTADEVAWPGPGLCAEWVADVYRDANIEDMKGDARDFFWNYCYYSDLRDLKPGMIVAVSSHPYTEMGSVYGHVGIYMGNGVVRQSMNEDKQVNEVPIWEWIEHFGYSVNPMWGWPLE